jgi:hypothetical protein
MVHNSKRQDLENKKLSFLRPFLPCCECLWLHLTLICTAYISYMDNSVSGAHARSWLCRWIERRTYVVYLWLAFSLQIPPIFTST